MSRFTLLLVALLFAWPLHATVYKHVDEHGNIVYTDEPVDGAKEIQLPKPQTYQPNNLAPQDVFNDSSSHADHAPQIDPSALDYTLAITYPESEATIPRGQTDIEFRVFIEPELHHVHQLVLIQDDEMINANVEENTLTLSELQRGEHTFEVHIIDAKRKHVIEKSQPIILYIQRPIAPAP